MVGVALYADAMEEWKQAVEDDPNADSLSHLIRVAISRHIYGRTGITGGEISDEIHDHLTDLHTQQQSVVQRLNGINGQPKYIHDAEFELAIDSETKEFVEDIFELLPTEQDVQTNPALSGDYDTSGVLGPESGPESWYKSRIRQMRCTWLARTRAMSGGAILKIDDRVNRWLENNIAIQTI